MNSGIFRGWYLLVFAVCLVAPGLVRGDDVPARPAQYFNDYANAVDAGTAQALNNELVDFERQTSNQIVVVVYPKLKTEDSLDDFCYRTYQAWQVGQKGSSNGAVLFVFVQDHKMRIQTGYGLEGALPDVTCVRILDDEMAPRFKSGDYAGGLKAGIDAMIAATKGEYKGTGETVADKDAQDENNTFGIIFAVCFLILWVFLLVRKTRGILYGASGRSGFRGGFFTGSGGGGGDGFSGGGGGFSGGGGSSGGGGASGSW